MERDEAEPPEMPRGPAKGDFTTWTNEKHNSYLDALEASFVDQLHNSWGLKKKRFSTSPARATLDDANYPLDQFAVLCGGFWWKKVFGKELSWEKLSNIPWMDSMENYLFWSEQLKLSEKKLFTIFSECPIVCHRDQDSFASSADRGEISMKWLKKAAAYASPRKQIMSYGNILIKETTFTRSPSSKSEEQIV